jgi:formyltetrahydrofolate hydrolase
MHFVHKPLSSSPSAKVHHVWGSNLWQRSKTRHEIQDQGIPWWQERIPREVSLSKLWRILGLVQANFIVLAYLMVSPLGKCFAILQPIINIHFTNLPMLF